MGIPAAFAFNLVALKGLVTAKNILYGTRHYVVDTGHTISARRALVKCVRVICGATAHTFLEDLVVFPKLQYLLARVG